MVIIQLITRDICGEYSDNDTVTNLLQKAPEGDFTDLKISCRQLSIKIK